MQKRSPGECLRRAHRQFFEQQQRVHKDITFGMILRRPLHSLHRRNFGKDFTQQSAFIKQLKRPLGAAFISILVNSSRTRSCETWRICGARCCMAENVADLDLVIEARRKAHAAQHAQLVFRKTPLRIADRANDSGFKIVASSDEVQNAVCRIDSQRIKHHAVNREVAALHILARIIRKTHFVGMSPIGVANIGTELAPPPIFERWPRKQGSQPGRTACSSWYDAPMRRLAVTSEISAVLLRVLCGIRRNRNQHNSELLADSQRSETLHHLLRSRIGRNIVVSRFALQQQVANASARQLSLMSALAQSAHNVGSVLLCVRHVRVTLRVTQNKVPNRLKASLEAKKPEAKARNSRLAARDSQLAPQLCLTPSSSASKAPVTKQALRSCARVRRFCRTWSRRRSLPINLMVELSPNSPPASICAQSCQSFARRWRKRDILTTRSMP